MKQAITIVMLSLAFVSAEAQETGKIYFLGVIGGYKAFIDKSIVCHIGMHSYSVHDVQPGKHQVDVQSRGTTYKGKNEPFFINVEAGKSYFVQVLLRQRIGKVDLYCQEITENTANTILPDLKIDSDCAK